MPAAELLDIDWVAELRRLQDERIKRRSAGRHLSEIVHRIIEKVEPGRYGSGPVDPATAHIGFLWEDLLAEMFAKQLGWQQIETECEGIFMTLDGLKLRDNGQRVCRVLEAKGTKISATNPITSRKFLPWTLRTAGYCTAFDTYEAEIMVLFINGSYELAGGRFGKMQPKGWKLTFGKRERQENWEWILRERDEMDREEAKQRWV